MKYSFADKGVPLGLLLLLTVTLFGQTPEVQNGIIDARQFDLTNQQLTLKGSWIWYDNQLLNPQEIQSAKGIAVEFPKIWNETRASQQGQGYATYTVSVLLPAGVTSLGLDIPEAYSSYKMWANGKVIAQNGVVGTTKELTKPQWVAKVATFDRPGDTLQLVFQISNFRHHKGGMKSDIKLGEVGLITSKFQLAKLSSLIECFALLLLSIVFLILYFLKDRKKVIIYFALLCFTWSLRSVFSNSYVFISFFPDFSWTTAVRIEYMTLYFTMIWCILFLGRLFVNEASQIIKYILVIINSIFAAFTILTSPLAFTRWLNIYLIVAGLLVLYGVIMVIRAVINERIGSIYLTLSTLLSALLFGYDIFAYQGIFPHNPMVIGFGYITMFVLMAFALLLHLNIIKSTQPTTMLRYDDLYKKDDKVK